MKRLQQMLQWQPALAAAGASADGALIVVIPGVAACLAAVSVPTPHESIKPSCTESQLKGPPRK